MSPERIWLGATALVLLLGGLLVLLGYASADARLGLAGRWTLAAGILLAFLPLLLASAWLLWEKIAPPQGKRSPDEAEPGAERRD
jgi:hypothetical protein